MEELYARMLKDEMDEFVGTMTPSTPSIYDGEDALVNLLHCVKLTHKGYEFRMDDVDHETLIELLLSIKDIGLEGGKKRHPHKEEFESMGIAHLAHYVTFKKTGLYTIRIPELPFTTMRKIISILFIW